MADSPEESRTAAVGRKRKQPQQHLTDQDEHMNASKRQREYITISEDESRDSGEVTSSSAASRRSSMMDIPMGSFFTPVNQQSLPPRPNWDTTSAFANFATGYKISPFLSVTPAVPTGFTGDQRVAFYNQQHNGTPSSPEAICVQYLEQPKFWGLLQYVKKLQSHGATKSAFDMLHGIAAGGQFSVQAGKVLNLVRTTMPRNSTAPPPPHSQPMTACSGQQGVAGTLPSVFGTGINISAPQTDEFLPRPDSALAQPGAFAFPSQAAQHEGAAAVSTCYGLQPALGTAFTRRAKQTTKIDLSKPLPMQPAPRDTQPPSIPSGIGLVKPVKMALPKRKPRSEAEVTHDSTMTGDAQPEIACEQLSFPETLADSAVSSQLESDGNVIRLRDLAANDQEKQRLFYRITDPDAIARCLMCGAPGHTKVKCQLPRCTHCNAWGEHLSRNCPTWVKCGRCRQRGHMTKGCKAKRSVKGGGPNDPCDICGMTLHTEEDCGFVGLFDAWDPTAANGNKIPRSQMRVSCYNCSSKKHWGDDCPLLDRNAKRSGYHSEQWASRFIIEDDLHGEGGTGGGQDWQLSLLED